MGGISGQELRRLRYAGIRGRRRCRTDIVRPARRHSGCQPLEPICVQDGLHTFLLWRTSPPRFAAEIAAWAGVDAPDFGATPNPQIATHEFTTA